MCRQAQREGVPPSLTEEDHDDFCAELTTPSRNSSCLLSGAYSIQPASSANSLPEANFDCNGLGFFRDVGVDTLTLSGSEYSPFQHRLAVWGSLLSLAPFFMISEP